MPPRPTATAPNSPRRLVLDTNVWLDLLLFDDPCCTGVRTALAAGDAVAVVDDACRDEWQRVLSYPALRLSAQHAAELRSRFDAIAIALDAPLRALPWPRLPRCRDRDDQKFLELACRADAAALLTRDDALLALAGHARRLGLFAICRPESLAQALLPE